MTRRGRPRSYPDGTVIQNTLVALSDADRAVAVALGGTVCAGIRRALAIAAASVESPKELFATHALAVTEAKREKMRASIAAVKAKYADDYNEWEDI